MKVNDEVYSFSKVLGYSREAHTPCTKELALLQDFEALSPSADRTTARPHHYCSAYQSTCNISLGEHFEALLT